MESENLKSTEKIETEKGKEKNETKKVDLDSILVEELGQFGLYQFKMMVLAIIVVVFAAWAAVEYIFTTARINSRCLILECETIADAEFFQPWILNAVPGTSNTSFESCTRFTNRTTVTTIEPTCPATLFNQQQQIDCEQNLYQNQETVVYDYDLGCEEWRRSLIGSVRTLGVLVAMPLTGFISDRWGRRIALVFNAFNTAWLGSVRYFAGTYYGFLVSEFVEAVFGAGNFTCTYILVMELLGPKYRVAGGVIMNTFFAVGQVTIGLIAWALPTWRQLTLALYLPQLITISFFWLTSESVRWYMAKGRYEEAEKVLREVARVNKKVLSEKSVQGLRDYAEEEKRKQALEAESRANEPWLIVQVFKNKPILLRVCVSPVWWITTTFIYYGLSINSANLSGNRYFNYMAVSAIEIPGFWIAFVLLGIVGRKAVLAGSFWVCAACQIAFIFIPDGNNAASLAVYMIGKCAIATVMSAIYVYTSELYPTKYRNSLFAFASMMGRIGSILAPLTPALASEVWEHLPFTLFGGMALLSGLLVLLTPETLGRQLPDTMEQAAQLSEKKTDV